MTLQQKLEQYGHFGEGDLPAIKEVFVETDTIFEQLILNAQCVDEDMLAQVENLRDKMNALVDGKSMKGSVDDLWASINWTHSQFDEGKIDRDAAQAECDAAIAQYAGMLPVEQVDDTKQKWEALIEDGAFVTMTVPVQVALLVVDNEAGDAHANAVFNLEEKLCEDFLEEYGVDEDSAWKINEALSKGGA